MIAMWNATLALLRDYPIVEGIFGVITLLAVQKSWAGPEDVDPEPEVEERQLGASVLLGQLSGTITAGTVVLGLIAAFAALAYKSDPAILTHVRYGAIWALASLGSCVYGFGVMPGSVNKRNPVKLKALALFAAAGLSFFLVSAGRLVCAVLALH